MGILLTEADAAVAGAGGISLISMLLMYAVVIGAMWFFLMRPQSKEKKRVAAMLSALEVGDCVLTTSGFYGIVIDIKDDMVIVEFGSNKNCRIPMEKSAISRVEKAIIIELLKRLSQSKELTQPFIMLFPADILTKF